jgi:hypothetical protein
VNYVTLIVPPKNLFLENRVNKYDVTAQIILSSRPLLLFGGLLKSAPDAP